MSHSVQKGISLLLPFLLRFFCFVCMFVSGFVLLCKMGRKVAEDPITQDRATARVLIAQQNARLHGPLNKLNKFASSQYWSYGYMGGTMLSLFGLTSMLGVKMRIFASYGSWVAIAGGYFGGSWLHAYHRGRLTANAVSIVDSNLNELEKLNERYGQNVPEYGNEIRTAKGIRDQLAPPANPKDSAASMDMDARVNSIVARFDKKKAPTSGKA